jgi:hypothetical protein
LFGGTAENHEKPYSGESVPQPKFKMSTSQTQERSIIICANAETIIPNNCHVFMNEIIQVNISVSGVETFIRTFTLKMRAQDMFQSS